MKFDEMLDAVYNLAEQFVQDNTEPVKPQHVGLDKRAAYELFINEDMIVGSLERDKDLQYYGGFEYVNSEFRTVVEGYVFYSCEDSRVQEHIQKWLESK